MSATPHDSQAPGFRLGEILGIVAAIAMLGYWGVNYTLERLRETTEPVELPAVAPTGTATAPDDAGLPTPAATR